MKKSDTTIRVLLVDDDLADRELTSLALEKADLGSLQVTIAKSLSEAKVQLECAAHDIMLLDLGLPECCGMETLLRIREINESIPIVILTDLADEEIAMECLNKGAQDYLLKSHLALETLNRSVRYAIQRQQLHEQLMAANGLLEQRNKDLARLCDTAQRFVDNVSHEFRTPLTVITEYVSLLQDGVVGTVALDKDQKRFLGILADRADDLNTMVDDMLDVSKLQSGLLSLWRKDCHLPEILRRLKPSLKSKARIKNLDLVFDVDPDPSPIYCDDEKLGRVIINLAVNAIKFSGESGQVCISATENKEDHELIISVSDNGPGISHSDQEKIFGRFQQIESQTHRTQKGFGLGLSIAKELVELNLGEMTVTSESGVGSTFSFSVPLANPVEVTQRYLHRLGRNSSRPPKVALLELTVTVQGESKSDDVDALLNFVLRPEDILFRCGDHRWIFVIPVTDLNADEYMERTIQMWQDGNRNRPGNPLPELNQIYFGQWETDKAEDLLAFLDTQAKQRELCHVGE